MTPDGRAEALLEERLPHLQQLRKPSVVLRPQVVRRFHKIDHRRSDTVDGKPPGWTKIIADQRVILEGESDYLAYHRPPSRGSSSAEGSASPTRSIGWTRAQLHGGRLLRRRGGLCLSRTPSTTPSMMFSRLGIQLAYPNASQAVRPARNRRDGGLLPLANDEDFDHRVGVPMLVHVMMARFTNAATFAPTRNAQ